MVELLVELPLPDWPYILAQPYTKNTIYNYVQIIYFVKKMGEKKKNLPNRL